jgi:spore germination protein KC
MRGNLSESTCQQYHDTSDINYLEEIETAFAEEIKKNILYSFNIAKREGIDTLYLRKNLKAYEPAIWAQIQDRWDEIYPNIPLEVTVRVSIQNVGEHK